MSATKVRRAKPTNKDQWLNDGDGLYLRIRKGGSRNWIIRRKRLGKTEIITLGDTLSLKEAGKTLKVNKSVGPAWRVPGVFFNYAVDRARARDDGLNINLAVQVAPSMISPTMRASQRRLDRHLDRWERCS